MSSQLVESHVMTSNRKLWRKFSELPPIFGLGNSGETVRYSKGRRALKLAYDKRTVQRRGKDA